MSLITVISAPSGSGKTTICNALFSAGINVSFSISATTRSPRTGDVDGVHYHFLSHEEFEQKIEAGEFLEWAKVHNNYYGTLKSEFAKVDGTKKVLLLDIDWQGWEQVKAFKSDYNMVSIFILPPSQAELKRRLIERDSSIEGDDLQTRLDNAILETSKSDMYDYSIENKSLANTVDMVIDVIEKHNAGK